VGEHGPVGLLDGAVDGRDDAGGHGGTAGEREGVADRHDGRAHPGRFRGERQRIEPAGVDAEHGQVGAGVGADDLRRVLLAVDEGDADVVAARDHVVVGEDEPRRVEHEPGSDLLPRLRFEEAADRDVARRDGHDRAADLAQEARHVERVGGRRHTADRRRRRRLRASLGGGGGAVGGT